MVYADIVILFVVFISALGGLFLGFVSGLWRLIGLFLGFFLATSYYVVASEFMRELIPTMPKSVADNLSFVALLILVLIFFRVTSGLVSKALGRSGNFIDKILGLVFAFFKNFIIVSVVVHYVLSYQAIASVHRVIEYKKQSSLYPTMVVVSDFVLRIKKDYVDTPPSSIKGK